MEYQRQWYRASGGQWQSSSPKIPVFQKQSKPVAIWYRYIQDFIRQRDISLEYLSTKEMIADRLTKPLGSITFKEFIKSLGLTTVAMAMVEPLSNARLEWVRVLACYLYIPANCNDTPALVRAHLIYLASVDSLHPSLINHTDAYTSSTSIGLGDLYDGN